MRLLSAALCTTVAAALLASCSGGSSPSSSLVPGGSTGVGQMGQHHGMPLTTIPKKFLPTRWDGKLHGKKAPASELRGQYAAEFYVTSGNVLGYPKNNSGNGPPICTLSTGSNVNGLGVDTKGVLMVPDAFDGLLLFGPGMCGAPLGTISDVYGQASDAAALDAQNGTIVVGNITGGSADGVVTCTLASDTCTPLFSPGQIENAGVAMDKAGNCYVDGLNESDIGTLWLFPGCTGTGQVVSGFSQPFFGGIDIDNQGNLIAISLFNSSFTTPSQATVYSGCATGTCTLKGGPFALFGESVFGHLGRQNERFVAGDPEFGQQDIYAYTGHGTGLTYLYSFNNGLSASGLTEAAAYSPSSQSK
jgi:hypothetical protein